MQDYSVDNLIASARRRGQLTKSAGSLDLPDLVALMDEELKSYMMGFLLSLKEEFAVDTFDFTTTSGVFKYPLPPRAVGGKIREILVDVDGDGEYIRIARVEPQRMIQPPKNTSTPSKYWFEGNSVVLDPCGQANVRIKYFRRPGSLTLKADAGQITNINTGTNTVTLATPIPTTFSTSVTYDFIQSQPYFETLQMDLGVSSVNSGTGVVICSGPLPTPLAVGDYLCLAGTSPVPQIPVELHSLLARRTNVVALEALDDEGGLKIAQAMLADAERRAHWLVDDRDEGAPRYIINRWGPGFKRFHVRLR